MKLPLNVYIVLIIGTSVFLLYYEVFELWMSMSINNKEYRPGMIIKHRPRLFLKNAQCKKRMSSEQSWNSDLPPLYIITPTYRRAEQLPELTRLAHTLMLVPKVYWLVIEDAIKKTHAVTELLESTGLRYEHLLAPMPVRYRLKKKALPKGVSNRNRGLSWIRMNATEGVFYFADDDNTYDLEIFCQMRFTQRVSMWPVGLVTKLGVSSPIVIDGLFAGFYDGWMGGRKFPVDMAGFAVSVQFLLERPNATMPFRAGFEEDGFLRSLFPFEPHQIELLASNCTKILVWHTQTKKNHPSLTLNTTKYGNTNIVVLKENLV